MLKRLTLTARLTLLHALVSAGALLGLGGLVVWASEVHFIELDRAFLADKARLVQQLVQHSAGQTSLRQRLDELQLSHPDLLLQLDATDAPLAANAWQRVYASPDASFPAELTSATPPDHSIDWVPDAVHAHASHGHLRGSAQQWPAPTWLTAPGRQARVRLLLAVNTRHHDHFVTELRHSVALYVSVVALLSGLLGWWAAKRGLAPLRLMQNQAQAVSAQRLDQRMPVEAVPIEMAELARGLNTMLARLEADFERLSAFSSDLAHELRTPISNLLTQTQVVLAQPRDATTYQDTLASNAEELQRLSRMVSDMLFLAKAEHGLALPHREPIDLHTELLALFDFYDALAEDRHLSLQLTGTAHTEGDRLMVRRAASNLLSNALRHATPGTCIRVNLAQSAAQALVSVRNVGTSIPADQLPRLFDRFYRADKARSHNGTHPEDGTGLGLPITRAIMNAHGGTVHATSEVDGACFVLTFPSA